MFAKEIIAMQHAKAGYNHNTRIIVKCNPACQNYTLKNQHLLEVFTANSGRRGRCRSVKYLGPTPISLQSKDPTSLVIIQQPLYLESTFFYLQASIERKFLKQLFRKGCFVCTLAGRGGSSTLLSLWPCATERETTFESPSSSEVRDKIVGLLLSLYVEKCNRGV